ncbi:MAG: MmgE/PrpD family protein [Pseudarthrobacter sp.]|nr:MmgE/PrpD family protein [Pseudarthrobacter sp.]
MATIVEQLAGFTTTEAQFSALPDQVIRESKRILLDSFGCALAAHGERGAEIGVKHGQRIGAGTSEATILGAGGQVSVFGAAFANAELINALDFDTVVPPGHVAPYVIPGALAVAEQRGASGQDLISAVAVAHEMSYRIGKAMGYLRDIKDGKPATPDVIGFSVTVFGAAAAIAQVQKMDTATVGNVLGIAGSISPVNSQRAWVAHAPSTTIKYLLPGQLTQTALTAASMGELGHRGDLLILDDAEYGYPKFIGSKRWAKDVITSGLGKEWRFPTELNFKPYPHCRVMHALMDALIDIVKTNDLRPEDIESIRAWGEAWIMEPIWVNRVVEDVRDAQFSMAHGLSVAAHGFTPGKEWQTPDVVFSPSVLGLMDKITVEPHPDWAAAVSANPSARPSRIEVKAKGATFVAERSYPKGSVSPDPSTYFTDEELVEKFRHNAEGVLEPAAITEAVDALLNLEAVTDVRTVTRLLAGVPARV